MAEEMAEELMPEEMPVEEMAEEEMAEETAEEEMAPEEPAVEWQQPPHPLSRHSKAHGHSSSQAISKAWKQAQLTRLVAENLRTGTIASQNINDRCETFLPPSGQI